MKVDARTHMSELGYGEGPSEVRRFQRDYNAMPPRRILMVSGELDAATRGALSSVHEARVMFLTLREIRRRPRR